MPILAALLILAGVPAPAVPPPVNEIVPDGNVLDWVLLGPFPTWLVEPPPPDGIRRAGFSIDYLKPLGGEAAAVLEAGSRVEYKDRAGRTRTLQARRIGPAFENRRAPVFNHIRDGFMGVRGFAPGQPYIIEEDFNEAVGYAFCYLKSDKPRRVYAYFRTYVDGQKVWLNGKLVQSPPAER
jgi:hypothetical protein